jgi:DNA-binding MarR family transcriptional regulator
MLKIPSSAPHGLAQAGDSPRAVVRALADVVGLAEPRLVDLWRSTGITFGQRRVLGRLRHGPRSAGALADELGIAPPTLTRQLQKLQDGGLVTRAIDDGDRRRVVVALTSAGEATLADHAVFRNSPLSLAAHQLSPKQRRELIEGLGRLVRLARQQESAPPGE